MNWNRVKCAVLGHKWQVAAGRWPTDVTSPADCVRCAKHYTGISWSRAEPCECGKPAQCMIWSPTGPRPGHHKPPPPPPPPPRKDVMRIKVELDGLEEAKAEVAKLHAQWTEVLAMREEAKGIATPSNSQ